MLQMFVRVGIVVALIIAPSLAFAAASDVSMDTSVILSIGGIEVDISGATAVVESITVNDSTFSFVLQDGSSIEMTAPARNVLNVDSTTDRTTDTCSTAASVLKYVGTAARTITVTPSGILCSGGSSTHSSSSSSSRAAPATPAVPAVLATPATPASGLSSTQITAILSVLASFGADSATIAKVQAALSGTGGTTTTTTTGSVTSTAVTVFKSNLTTGSLGSEVKALQQFLNAHGYTVASSGPGSSGNETTMFGGLTRAALVKYQKTKGITPAVGYFGAITRAAINSEK